MSNVITELTQEEISEIRDFLDRIEDFGHIYMLGKENLDAPFKKIMDGINEIDELLGDSFGI